MIIKNLFKYLKINPLVYLAALLAVLTASFVQFFIISILIIFHELGHFLVAKILKIEVDKIYLYPLGGISKFNLMQNEKNYKEFLILISGPLFQHITYIFLIILLPQYKESITILHYGILFFNLMPIYPLDGGKLLNLFLSTRIPYKISIEITIKISYIITFSYFVINYTNMNLKLNVILMTLFLLFKIKNSENKISINYERFLLERYLYKFNFKKTKIINNQNKFYKNHKHIIKENGKYYLENEYLLKKYQKK